MDLAEEIRALRAELAQMREEIAANAKQNARTAELLIAVTRDDQLSTPSQPRPEGCD